MLKRLFALLLITTLYFPILVQAFGSYELQYIVHVTAVEHAEQSHHDIHHHYDDIQHPLFTLDSEQPHHLIILPLLPENHEDSGTFITIQKNVLNRDDDSDNNSMAVLTDYAYGRAFSPLLVAPNPSLFHSCFSQRDLFLQTQRLRI